MIYLKGNHPYHFRAGEWAHLFSVQHDAEGRDLWVVEFPDGAKDVWPSWDATADYDVKVQIEPLEEFNHDDQEPPPSYTGIRAHVQGLLTEVTYGDLRA